MDMTKSSKLLGIISGLKVLFLTLVLTVAASACSKSQNTTTIALELSSNPGTPVQPAIDIAFDETNSLVLRCISITENGNKITATVTKAKTAAITTLIFVNLAYAQDSGLSTVKIACVSPDREESNYDISQGFYRNVKLTSAISATKDYGLYYEDWMTGLMSQDQLFPCCQ
jgi:hypothetical protein